MVATENPEPIPDVSPLRVRVSRDKQLQEWRAGTPGVLHPDQVVRETAIRIQIADDGATFWMNDVSLPTHAIRLTRTAPYRAFSATALRKIMRELGFPCPRGKAKPGASWTVVRALPHWVSGPDLDLVELLPGEQLRDGEIAVVFPCTVWDREFCAADPDVDLT